MDFAKKNNFVVKHASANYFEKDKAYFIKVFPFSPLVVELKKANQFNKKQLDERILYDLLNNVCPESILENRGIIKPAGVTDFDVKAEAQKELLNTASLDDLSITRKKEIVKALELSIDNEEVESVDMALTDYINALNSDSEPKNEQIKEEPTKEEGNLPAEIEAINKELKEATTLDDIAYARKKHMVNILNLSVADNKQETYDAALTLYLSASATDDKKKQDPEPNTPTSTGH